MKFKRMVFRVSRGNATSAFYSIDLDPDEYFYYSPFKQRNFYNIAAKFKTLLLPDELLKTLKRIEKELGRKKTYRWGPRVIDIDILFYGKKVVKTKNLTVPHKEISNRAFVLVPLKEISPAFVHPVLRKQVKTLCVNLTQNKAVKRIEKI